MLDEKLIKQALELIENADKILITTHTRPDGDACGSVIAIGEMLKGKGKEVKTVIASPLPQWYEFLFEEKPAILGHDFKVEELIDGSFFCPDLTIIVDTNSYNQLDGLAEFIKANKKPVLVIDHHKTNDALGDVEITDTDSAAAGLVIYNIFKQAGWEFNHRIAQALFAAIATDTGWFRFASTTAAVHASCSELISFGVDSENIYHRLYQSYTPERFDLMKAMLNNMTLYFDGRYAEQYLSIADFERTSAQYRDTEALIDQCQKIISVEVAAFFVELKDGRVKCSLRSRAGIDVRKIAQKFGGGGHTQAAGLHLNESLENARKIIYAEIENCLKN